MLFRSPARDAPPSPASESPTGAAAKKRKLSYKDQRDLDTIEERIAAAEARLGRATAESALPENMSNSVALARLSKEMAEAQAEVDRLYARWAELES